MMVTKKNKFNSFFLTLLVFCIISVALIITLMDKQAKDDLNELKELQQQRFDAMQDIIDSMKKSADKLDDNYPKYSKDMEKLEKLIEEIKANSYSEADYHEATLVRAEKLLILSKTFYEFENKIDELGFDIDEVLVYGSDYTEYTTNLYNQAWIAIERAPSVAKQDEVINNFKNTLETMPNRVQKVYNALEKLEKEGITLSDKGNIYAVINCLNDMPKDANGNPLYTESEIDSLYAPDEKEALMERLDTAIITYIGLVVADFNAQVDKLDKDAHGDYKFTTLANEEAIKKAETTRNELKVLCESQSDKVQRAYKNATAIATDYNGFNKTLNKYRNRLDQLLAAKVAADAINESLEKYNKNNMKPNSETLAEIQDFESAINEWFKNSKHNIVTPEIDAQERKNGCTDKLHEGSKAVCQYCGYVAANYNMVNHSALQSLKTEYNKLTNNKLTTLVQGFIDAVNKIYSDNEKTYGLDNMITPNDEKVILNTAHTFYKLWYEISTKSTEIGLASKIPSTTKAIATASSLKDKDIESVFNVLDTVSGYSAAASEIDYILGFVDSEAKNGFVAAIATLRQARADYNHIVEEIAKLDEFTNVTIHEIVHNTKNDHSGKTCKCDELSKEYSVAYIVSHQSELKEMDNIIYDLLVDYDLDYYLDVLSEKATNKLTDVEKKISALLDKYMEVRLVPIHEEALTSIENMRASFRGTVHQAQADKVAADLVKRVDELYKEDYVFTPAVEIVNGFGEYVGKGVWADSTNEIRDELQSIIDNLGASFTFENPEITN